METNKRYLSPKDVEEIYNIPITTLEQWRSKKRGPIYHKLGKHIRYTPLDVDKWVEARKIQTTP